jgi:hypothetical protein
MGRHPKPFTIAQVRQPQPEFRFVPSTDMRQKEYRRCFCIAAAAAGRAEQELIALGIITR